MEFADHQGLVGTNEEMVKTGNKSQQSGKSKGEREKWSDQYGKVLCTTGYGFLINHRRIHNSATQQ